MDKSLVVYVRPKDGESKEDAMARVKKDNPNAELVWDPEKDGPKTGETSKINSNVDVVKTEDKINILDMNVIGMVPQSMNVIGHDTNVSIRLNDQLPQMVIRHDIPTMYELQFTTKSRETYWTYKEKFPKFYDAKSYIQAMDEMIWKVYRMYDGVLTEVKKELDPVLKRGFIPLPGWCGINLHSLLDKLDSDTQQTFYDILISQKITNTNMLKQESDYYDYVPVCVPTSEIMLYERLSAVETDQLVSFDDIRDFVTNFEDKYWTVGPYYSNYDPLKDLFYIRSYNPVIMQTIVNEYPQLQEIMFKLVLSNVKNHIAYAFIDMNMAISNMLAMLTLSTTRTGRAASIPTRIVRNQPNVFIDTILATYMMSKYYRIRLNINFDSFAPEDAFGVMIALAYLPKYFWTPISLIQMRNYIALLLHKISFPMNKSLPPYAISQMKDGVIDYLQPILDGSYLPSELSYSMKALFYNSEYVKPKLIWRNNKFNEHRPYVCRLPFTTRVNDEYEEIPLVTEFNDLLRKMQNLNWKASNMEESNSIRSLLSMLINGRPMFQMFTYYFQEALIKLAASPICEPFIGEHSEWLNHNNILEIVQEPTAYFSIPMMVQWDRMVVTPINAQAFSMSGVRLQMAFDEIAQLYSYYTELFNKQYFPKRERIAAVMNRRTIKTTIDDTIFKFFTDNMSTLHLPSSILVSQSTYYLRKLQACREFVNNMLPMMGVAKEFYYSGVPVSTNKGPFDEIFIVESDVIDTVNHDKLVALLAKEEYANLIRDLRAKGGVLKFSIPINIDLKLYRDFPAYVNTPVMYNGSSVQYGMIPIQAKWREVYVRDRTYEHVFAEDPNWLVSELPFDISGHSAIPAWFKTLKIRKEPFRLHMLNDIPLIQKQQY